MKLKGGYHPKGVTGGRKGNREEEYKGLGTELWSTTVTGPGNEEESVKKGQ